MQSKGKISQNNQSNTHKRDYDIQPIHIKFDANDSQGSDVSYESSLSSSNDDVGDAENFRQQMSRFFINHPDLVNPSLIQNKEGDKNLWQGLATDIMNEAKEQPISLESIAKRIAYYQRKCQQNDIIDLIVQEKDLLLNDLIEEEKLSEQQLGDQKEDQKNKKASVGTNLNDNSYFSWRKKHEAQIITNVRKNSNRKANSSVSQDNTNRNTCEIRCQKTKNNSLVKTKMNRTASNEDININQLRGKGKIQNIDSINEEQPNKIFQSKNCNNAISGFLNFQPKSEPAKQLLQELKKHNSSDEIGIKRTIINYLVKYRNSVQKQLINKTNLSQRISRLHVDDSKELLLFCPIKLNGGEPDMPLDIETSQFLQILQEISEGHLMKYWKLLQEKKL